MFVMSVDLSKCKVGEDLKTKNGKDIKIISFEEIDIGFRKGIKKIVRCSDGIYRLLDGTTPYGFPDQDIYKINRLKNT